MKKILILLLLLNLLAGVSFAQSNPYLIRDLNEVRYLEIKARQQYQYHNNKYNLPFLYYNILINKENTINDLTQLLVDLNGTIKKTKTEFLKVESIFEALNDDAYMEIQILRSYNKILSAYGHPKVRKITQKAKDYTLENIMLFTNAAQKELFLNKKKEFEVFNEKFKNYK